MAIQDSGAVRSETLAVRLKHDASRHREDLAMKVSQLGDEGRFVDAGIALGAHLAQVLPANLLP